MNATREKKLVNNEVQFTPTITIYERSILYIILKF